VARRATAHGARLPERAVEVSSLAAQWGAAVVDGVGAAAVVVGVMRLMMASMGVRPSVQGVVDALHDNAASLLPLVVAVPVGVALWHLSALVLQATPGQRLWRLRLVDQQGRRPAALRLVVRAIVQGAGVLAVFAGPAWALLIDGRRRGPGDIVAGTVAVRAASVVAIAGPRA
jgi:uncharacterized RDD family membrane protein YckC